MSSAERGKAGPGARGPQGRGEAASVWVGVGAAGKSVGRDEKETPVGGKQAGGVDEEWQRRRVGRGEGCE